MKITQIILALVVLMAPCSVAIADLISEDQITLDCSSCQKNFNCPYGEDCPEECFSCYPEYDFWW